MKKYIISILISFLVSAFFSYMPLDMNPMGEHCEQQGINIRASDYNPNKKTYIKKFNSYEKYDPNTHKNIRIIYEEYKGKNILNSNWTNSGNPCVITNKLWKWFFSLWIIISFIFFIPMGIWDFFKLLTKRKDHDNT